MHHSPGLLARVVQHSARALSALKTLISSGQTRPALHFSSGILTFLLPAQSAGRPQLCFWGGLLLLFCLYHNLDQQTDGRLPATLLPGPCPSCCLLPMDRFLVQGIPTDFSWSPGLCHLSASPAAPGKGQVFETGSAFQEGCQRGSAGLFTSENTPVLFPSSIWLNPCPNAFQGASERAPEKKIHPSWQSPAMGTTGPPDLKDTLRVDVQPC